MKRIIIILGVVLCLFINGCIDKDKQNSSDDKSDAIENIDENYLDEDNDDINDKDDDGYEDEDQDDGASDAEDQENEKDNADF